MADKNYFEFLDIPDGSGGSDRWHVKDAEAQASIAQVASNTYTKSEVDEMALATMFQLYVDPEDMHLKGKPTGYGTFEVVDGHLILHQTE